MLGWIAKSISTIHISQAMTPVHQQLTHKALISGGMGEVIKAVETVDKTASTNDRSEIGNSFPLFKQEKSN